MVRSEGQPFDINIMQVWASTSDATEEEIEQFYTELEAATLNEKSRTPKRQGGCKR